MRAKRRGRVTEDKVQYFLKSLGSFNLAIDRVQDLSLLEDIHEFAELYSLTAYDAAYLELAVRARIPLATLDDKLRIAATIEGVAVV